MKNKEEKKIEQKKVLLKIIFQLSILLMLLVSTNTTLAQWINIGLEDEFIFCLTAYNKNIYVGTSRDVFLTTNNGDAWISLKRPNSARSIAVKDSNIFVGTDCYLWISSDNGKTWTQIIPDSTTIFVNALMMCDTTLIVGTYYELYHLAYYNNEWKTTISNLRKTSVKCLAKSETTLYAGTPVGVYYSNDHGITWEKTSKMLVDTPYVSSIAVNGTNLFAGTSYGIFRSTDNGSNWFRMELDSSVRYVTALLTYGNCVFAGTDKGVYCSTDSGTIWNPAKSGMPDDEWIVSLIICGDNIFAGGEGVWRRPLSEIITSVENKKSEILSGFKLEQNYPNPFNPSTIIRYQIPSEFAQVVLSLKIYDMLGREVATLFEGIRQPGYYETLFDGSKLANGVYFYRLCAGSFIDTKKLILCR